MLIYKIFVIDRKTIEDLFDEWTKDLIKQFAKAAIPLTIINTPTTLELAFIKYLLVLDT